MSEQQLQIPRRRPLVWIVDDSHTETLIAERALGNGFDFERFGDGAVVVERLTAGAPQPDLVLLDWVMPGMAGDEVCKFLRTHADTVDLPIILITASRTETADVARGLAVGANDYVARPFANEELRARVDAAIRSKQLSDIAQQERKRLETINQLGRALFEAGTDVDRILDTLVTVLSNGLCDGCSILLLPGPVTAAAATRHRADPTGKALAAISSFADPVVHSFQSSAHARGTLPPAYTPYIDRFGLRGLAILPVGSREILHGVVTVTRDGGSTPFDAQDIATIETCMEYASLAVESAVRFDAERAGRGQLDAVLTSLPNGIIVSDADGVITLANAAAHRLFPDVRTGVPLADVHRLATWTTFEGTPITLAAWQDFARGGRIETLIRRPYDGEQLALAVSGVALVDGRGLSAGSVTVLQDITAQYAVNAEREESARFQQQMLGIVGHDLRAPLGAILIGTELLDLDLEAGSPPASVVKRIASSANRMTRMVDQLLDMTRARLGAGIPVVPRKIHLVPLIKTVIDELAAVHHTPFELVAPMDVTGYWDGDRLAQVVSNLAGNAVQYGLRNAPITVGVARVGSNVTISVHNVIRETPIPHHVIGTLFDPYRRGHDNEHNSTGLGLGLYIVHEIVRAHGGSVDVDSTDSGTTFRVHLPERSPTASG
ncbi:MAG: response regulator [Deltaproteobacteria bacterium]|nr:response regulator [Deltaproteobacteria bacterium]